jgi:hypothetical protein
MDAPSPSIGPSGQTIQQLLAFYGAPAYIRRAQHVQEALRQLIARCEIQREEWLSLVRTRLALLRGYVGDLDLLRPWLADEDQIGLLRDLEENLQPRLTGPVDTTASARVLKKAVHELVESLQRFNRRWREYVEAVDLTGVNKVREGYNRHYLLEKECAVRSAHAAR